MKTETLEMVMNEVKNHFVSAVADGEFTIRDGVLLFPGDAPGCGYMALAGAQNSGVWEAQAADGGMQLSRDGVLCESETFCGSVFCLRPPRSFFALVEQIDEWIEHNPVGAFVSESFGGYTYNRATGTAGLPATWQQTFQARLAPYRRMFDDLEAGV